MELPTDVAVQVNTIAKWVSDKKKIHADSLTFVVFPFNKTGFQP